MELDDGNRLERMVNEMSYFLVELPYICDESDIMKKYALQESFHTPNLENLQRGLDLSQLSNGASLEALRRPPSPRVLPLGSNALRAKGLRAWTDDANQQQHFPPPGWKRGRILGNREIPLENPLEKEDRDLCYMCLRKRDDKDEFTFDTVLLCNQLVSHLSSKTAEAESGWKETVGRGLEFSVRSSGRSRNEREEIRRGRWAQQAFSFFGLEEQ
ncbi:hypothetical protein WN51_11259 [Melipona quadrifasciata]|uniref:Uncharacterized protein n=1 Tax=Melipona quadrifasciata TaxID=166423 RepID=A0A0M9A3R6_9HYME|nr:hypothetical protein WN51_11259 [Melipona quadrifasciata]